MGPNVEVFGPTSYNRHFQHPLVGFLVDDAEAAALDLRAGGIEVVIPVTHDGDDACVHFRGPDGHLYELTQSPDGRRDSAPT